MCTHLYHPIISFSLSPLCWGPHCRLFSWPIDIDSSLSALAFTGACRAWANCDVISLLGCFVLELQSKIFEHLLNQRTFLVGLCVPFTQSKRGFCDTNALQCQNPWCSPVSNVGLLMTIYMAGLFIMRNGLFESSRQVLWLFSPKSEFTLARSEKKT